MDQLSRDVLLLICSYLDLGALASLSVVYPRLSNDIFRILRSTRWALKLRILPQYTSMAYISIPKSKSHISLPEEKPIQDDLLLGQWTELRGVVRKQIPYEYMHITYLDITQFGSASVPTDVKNILESIETDLLSLKYESRAEARKVLERVSFNPGATLYIHELTFEKATEPLIPIELTHIEDVWFCGDILPADFVTLLSSKIPSLCLTCDRLRKDCVVIVREYIKNFLDGRNQTSCRISSSGELLRHVFEDLAGVGEECMANGPRRVHLISALEETPIHCFIDAIVPKQMDHLSRDSLLLICSYLDLRALANLSVVYPKLSDDIFRILRSTRWALKLRARAWERRRLQAAVDGHNHRVCARVDLEHIRSFLWFGFVLIEEKLFLCCKKNYKSIEEISPQYTSMAYISVPKSKSHISLPADKSIQEKYRTLTSVQNDLLLEQWTELRGIVRKRIPYNSMHINFLDITQLGSASVPTDMKHILGCIRTDLLSLKYYSRAEARKILERVSFNPRATLYVHEIIFRKDTEPLIPTGLTNIEDVWLNGDILPADFITLLSLENLSLWLSCDRIIRNDFIVLLREYMKNFLDGRTNQTSCNINLRGRVLKNVFEDIAGVGEDCMANGPRHVHLISETYITYIRCFIDGANTCT